MDSFNDGVMILLWMAGVLLVPLALVHIYHAHSLAGTATRWSAIVFTAITVVLLATFGFQAVEWGAAKNGAFNDGADQAAGALFVAMFPAMAAGVLEGHLGHARAAARKAKQSWRGDGEADR
ncbi:hypothetical protein ACIG87_27325 [Micromonospora sp. NPDC051925]|uniref:hypothetical protein n=1 Tax=Micromonospora sp. NPDC051925 TaxID=3364288 RepID=UPI0037C9B36A